MYYLGAIESSNKTSSRKILKTLNRNRRKVFPYTMVYHSSETKKKQQEKTFMKKDIGKVNPFSILLRHLLTYPQSSHIILCHYVGDFLQASLSNIFLCIEHIRKYSSVLCKLNCAFRGTITVQMLRTRPLASLALPLMLL